MDNLVKTSILVSDLVPGMTVEIDGVLRTVCSRNLTRTHHGIAFNGDASRKTITRVQFKVPTFAGVVLR